ncbi:MAG: M20 family metallopeptidase [Dehalococcoidia bacterium]|nr:M20 family metallopeptidase [Dehalococcoidia bacterium]
MNTQETAALKSVVCEGVERQRERLLKLSRDIHDNPEPGMQEFKAARWISDYLESNGFSVERGWCGLETAFRARYGSGRPAIALMAEYDALPKLGHACGHNIIAASSAGAAICARPAVDALGGSVLVLGTPAEELYGGKAMLAERGAFSDLDAAMLVHPDVRDTAYSAALACIGLDVEFFGKAAHAAAEPEAGINALEAMVLSFNAINSLRQHVRDKVRIHGIITDGGEAPNIVPSHTAASFLVRATEMSYLGELQQRVLDCFVGASVATGARLQYKWAEVSYAPLRNNRVLAQAFEKNMMSLGRRLAPPDLERNLGSTDMGNVSQLVPSIHPMIAIAPRGVQGHSPEFALAASSEAGDKAVIDGAKALAMTVVDLLASPSLLALVKREFLDEDS